MVARPWCCAKLNQNGFTYCQVLVLIYFSSPMKHIILWVGRRCVIPMMEYIEQIIKTCFIRFYIIGFYVYYFFVEAFIRMGDRDRYCYHRINCM
jgi:hypothetical protein